MRREEEIALVMKAREWDTAAFGEIVRRYQNLVYATALQILKDPALAEDVAQEAFVAAFRSLQGLRRESSFPPWLRKITRNLALASHKERGRFGALEEAGILQSLPADAEPEAERERREADAFGEEVRRIVASLSDTLRFPVLLCYLDDLPTASDGKKKLQERIVRMAEKSFQVYRLPPDFAKRCICGCRRSEAARNGKDERG